MFRVNDFESGERHSGGCKSKTDGSRLTRSSSSGKVKGNSPCKRADSPYARSSSEDSDGNSDGGCIRKKQRRMAANTRERNRMHTVNIAFDMLREMVPSYPSNRKLSKIETLKLACAYIADMEALLKEHQRIQGEDVSLAANRVSVRRPSLDGFLSIKQHPNQIQQATTAQHQTHYHHHPHPSPPPYELVHMTTPTHSQAYSPRSYQSSDSELAYSPPAPDQVYPYFCTVSTSQNHNRPVLMTRVSSDSAVSMPHSGLVSHSVTYYPTPSQPMSCDQVSQSTVGSSTATNTTLSHNVLNQLDPGSGCMMAQ